MKKMCLFFIFLSYFGFAMGTQSDYFKILESTPDLSHKSTAFMPSVLLSPNDKRIDRLASTERKPFLVWSEGEARVAIVIDPRRKTGLLWWKKASRIKITEERWTKLKDGHDVLDSNEKDFINRLR